MTYQNPVWEIDQKFLEIENFLDDQKQQDLIKFFLHPGFPWAVTIDAVRGIDQNSKLQDDSIVGLYHTFVYDGQQCSNYFKNISWILDEFNKIGIDKNKIFRVRAGMFLKHPETEPHVCHVDAKVPHTTAVYYVNDCDGDLIIYNETYKSNPYKTPDFPVEIKRFSPSKGKLAIFDGKHYHSSSYPNKKPIRLAITFNFLD